MSNHLLSGFAKDDPERFAQLLGANPDTQETVEILTDIPDGLEADVVGRLTPEAARRLLNDLSDPVVIGWLSSCPADTARGILSHINRERSMSLISSIDDRSKRLGLKRLVEYPAGTIGESMLVNAIAIHESVAASDIQDQIQRQHGRSESPIVIVREDNLVKGVLDMVKLMNNRDPDARASDFRIKVKPVYAEATLSSLRDREEWHRMTSLPVVDYEGRLLGYVTRSQFERSLETANERGVFLQAGMELTRQFFEFMAYMLVLIFERRNPG
jgi:Mg/Co/Ni transporter MgtE